LPCLFEVDGSQKSGSGTILRMSIAFAALKHEPLHITNIRYNRPKPGLKPQHLEAVLTAAKLCNAQTQGVTLGSTELAFTPAEISGGKFTAQIGTAGSIPMLFMTVLPICLFAKEPVELRVFQGGTDTMQAPTINYLSCVFLPTLGKMGIEAELTVQRYGYYPKGNGAATLKVKPCKALKPLRLEEFGAVERVEGVSVCTFLGNRKVSERQAQTATETLSSHGYPPKIQIVNDTSNPVQKGSSLAVWAQTTTGALIGADALGELGKTAEAVGAQAAQSLLAELSAKATVDAHLADMLIPYFALAKDSSVFLTREVTDHIESNLWLAEKMLGVCFNVNRVGDLYRVEKLADP
jgi:RNA 3'-phosphate cyclase